jgi:hypothetical protein
VIKAAPRPMVLGENFVKRCTCRFLLGDYFQYRPMLAMVHSFTTSFIK